MKKLCDGTSGVDEGLHLDDWYALPLNTKIRACLMSSHWDIARAVG